MAAKGGDRLPGGRSRSIFCFSAGAFPSELGIEQLVVNTPGADLHKEPYTKKVILSHGGVYDNLGLETITKRCATLLVSDAGQKIPLEPDPHRDWVRHSLRVLDTVGVDRDATLTHDLLEIAVTHAVSAIPPDRPEHDLAFEMTSLEVRHNWPPPRALSRRETGIFATEPLLLL
jgi:hypothetical protein